MILHLSDEMIDQSLAEAVGQDLAELETAYQADQRRLDQRLLQEVVTYYILEHLQRETRRN